MFLVGLASLLAAARVLGELARRFRFPAVAGELTAGVLLGPTVLGRIYPGSVAWLFPKGPAAAMLSGFTLLAAVLLLTLAGLEIDLSVVWRRRREAAFTSLAGVALPMVLGVGLGLLLPDDLLVDPSRRTLFALFLGTALSISAMPVIAKTLLDLGLLRTDLGLLVMAAAMSSAARGVRSCRAPRSPRGNGRVMKSRKFGLAEFFHVSSHLGPRSASDSYVSSRSTLLAVTKLCIL